MRNPNILSILSIFLCGDLVAADIETIDAWTTELATFFEQELRSGLDEPFYAEQIVGLDKESVAIQIGYKQAACWVEALLQLAEEHSIEPNDIFVGANQSLINTELLPERDLNREIADCAEVAFNSTGINFNDDVKH